MVKKCIGLQEYYAYYKNKHENDPYGCLDYKTFSKVIKEINKEIRNHIVDTGLEFKLPNGIGSIVLYKIKTKVVFKEDGTMKINHPIDYKATKELWKEDEECRKNKQVVRHMNNHSNGYSFRIRLLHKKKAIKNKSILKLRVNRQLKRNLAQNIFKGTIDALTIDKYEKLY